MRARSNGGCSSSLTTRSATPSWLAVGIRRDTNHRPYGVARSGNAPPPVDRHQVGELGPGVPARTHRPHHRDSTRPCRIRSSAQPRVGTRPRRPRRSHDQPSPVLAARSQPTLVTPSRKSVVGRRGVHPRTSPDLSHPAAEGFRRGHGRSAMAVSDGACQRDARRCIQPMSASASAGIRPNPVRQSITSCAGDAYTMLSAVQVRSNTI